MERLPVELRGVKTDDDDSGGALQEVYDIDIRAKGLARQVACRHCRRPQGPTWALIKFTHRRRAGNVS